MTKKKFFSDSQGQIMIVQSAPTPPTSVPIKIISQPVVSSGIQIVRKTAPTTQQRVVTQLISPQSTSNQQKYVVKQGTGQQIIFASTSKDESSDQSALTHQFISGNRGNVTITRTQANQSPTILNKQVAQKPAPPSITVKQIRSPPLTAATQSRTILNKSASPNAQRVLVKNSSPGSVQAVNIPGKGVQYVRVLNSQAPSNVTITPRTISSSPKKIINSTLSPTNSSSRVLVPGKTSGTYTLVQAGGSNVRTIQRPQVVTKRISSPQKLIAVVKKEKDQSRPTVIINFLN